MTTLGSLALPGGVQTGPFGSQLHAAEYAPAGVGVVMPQDLGENEIRTDQMPYVSATRAESLAKHLLRPGDIVFSRRGDVTRRALVRERDGDVLCGTGCLRVRVDPSRADAAYLSYAVGTPTARAWIARHAVGATMLNLNTSILSALPVDVPTLEVQRAIAEVLGALDDKIAANRQAIDAGRRLVAEAWAAAGASRSQSVELSSIVEIAPRVPPVRAGAPAYLDMKNLPERGLLVSSWGHREPQGGARFMNGDTLMARITPCFENGKMAWVDFLDEGAIGYGSTEYIVLRARPGVPALVPYVVAASTDFRTYAAQHRTGTSGRQRVQARELGSYRLNLPQTAALDEFDAFAQAVVGRLGAARTENQRLAATRDELLPHLMSGRIAVKDAGRRVEDEV